MTQGLEILEFLVFFWGYGVFFTLGILDLGILEFLVYKRKKPLGILEFLV